MSNLRKVYTVLMEGASWCATDEDFENLQVSLAGFGDSPTEALGALLIAEKGAEGNHCAHVNAVSADNEACIGLMICPDCNCLYPVGEPDKVIKIDGEIPWKDGIKPKAKAKESHVQIPDGSADKT